MRRRDFTIGLLHAAAADSVQAQAKQHRIAIVRPAGSVALISNTGIRFYRAVFRGVAPNLKAVNALELTIPPLLATAPTT